MKKNIIGTDVFYTLAWSQIYKYDKYNAIRILPELAGILLFMTKEQNRYEHLIFYSCWRDGCRSGLKKFLDPMLTLYPSILDLIKNDKLYYRYTVVDTNLPDMQDIMYWLIQEYNPLYNDETNFSDSKRFKNILVRETNLNPDHVIEKIPGRF